MYYSLSKSLYTRAIQCPKSLWLKKHKPQVLTVSDASTQAIFDTGNDVGELACQLFPDGREVPFTRDYDEMMAMTKTWLEEGIENIYEATFSYDGILIMIDILHIDEDGVSLYEVKSSTSVKDIYLHDVSIQYYVLKNLGFTVKSVNVVHVDSSYVREDKLELEKLFSIVDVTDKVLELQKEIPDTLKLLEGYLDDKENEPQIDIGKYCNNPYECDAKAYCWHVQREIPEYSIFNIFNLGSKKQLELHDKGVVEIVDIPDDFPMTAMQKKRVDSWKLKETHVDKEKIKEFLSELTYPIYHLDFETFQQAIPLWKGIRPFSQIPFQYSLHIENADGTVEHKEFLAKDGRDTREELAKRLVEDIPTDVTVLAYSMSFEKGVIEKLAESFPQFSSHLLSINKNMKDLMIPFQNQHYISYKMKGKYSIKNVLPTMVPKFAKAYQELDGIHDGSAAMMAYSNLSKMPDDEKEKIREALLAYCKLDTLAMVEILNELKRIAT